MVAPSKETLIEKLRRSSESGQDITITSKQADIIVDLIDILRQAKYDANAAFVLASTALTRFKET